MPLSRKNTRTFGILLAGGMALGGCAAPARDVGGEITAAIHGPSAAPKPEAVKGAVAPASEAASPVPSDTVSAAQPATPVESAPAPVSTPTETGELASSAEPGSSPVGATAPSTRVETQPGMSAPMPGVPAQEWATQVVPAPEQATASASASVGTTAALAPSGGASLPEQPQPYVPPQQTRGALAVEKPESALKIARAAAAAGDYPLAVKLYRQLAASTDASPDVLSELGDALIAAQAIPEAQRAYGGALHKAPNHLGAMIGMGKVYLALNRPAEAQAYFERAYGQAPENRRVLNGLAVARDSTGDHGGAQEIYRRALALYPNDPSLRSNYELSLTLAGQGASASGEAPNAAAPVAAPVPPVFVAPARP